MRTAQAIVVAEHDLIAADLPAATGSSAWAPTAAASQLAVKIEPITPAWRVFEVIPQSYAVPVPPRSRCRPIAGRSYQTALSLTHGRLASAPAVSLGDRAYARSPMGALRARERQSVIANDRWHQFALASPTTRTRTRRASPGR